MRLFRLLYHSMAAENCGYEDYVSIRESAQKNNKTNNVTGMLVFGNGRFLQLLEGDSAAVNALYARILGDQRHSDLGLIEAGEIDGRLFPRWSMRSATLDDRKDGEIHDIILRYSTRPEFAPEELSAESAVGLIMDLAELAKD